MKIVIATHHFPPRYTGGVEMITRRLARWLTRYGNSVEIVCIESIIEGEGEVSSVEREQYQDFKVNRLTINLRRGPDFFRWSYDNPSIGRWFEEYLRQSEPDLVHIHSGYLLSSSIIPAAKRVGLPVVVSLHDYWFICPRIKLLRPEGSRCNGVRLPIECTWCLLTKRLRYQLPDRISWGLIGLVGRRLLSWQGLANYLSEGQLLRDMKERQQLMQERLMMADLVLTQSSFLRERVIAYGLPSDKIRLLPYGLDLSWWPSQVQNIPSDGTLRIGYLGQLASPKGVHLLIQAFIQLKSSALVPQLTVYGDFDQFPQYGRKLRKLAHSNPCITFAGRYENHRLPEILAKLDVVVVPSLWYEIGPLVTMEAFAARTPVIATDLPNMNAQVIHEVNGLLFAPDSVSDLARQLQRLLDEPNLVEHLRSGIRQVRTFEQEATEIAQIYYEVLGQSRQSDEVCSFQKRKVNV